MFVPNVSIKFDLPKETIIGQLASFDNDPEQKYEYSVYDPNEYLDITKDGKIFLKKTLGNEFLKYTNPYLKFKVNMKQNADKVRKTDIWFKIDIRNQQVPPLRYDFDKLNDSIDQYFLDGTSNLRLGQFQLDKNTYPPNRYVLRAVNQDVTLDDNGNLFIPNEILSSN